jgi:methyl-accepting chemotaxis protein
MDATKFRTAADSTNQLTQLCQATRQRAHAIAASFRHRIHLAILLLRGDDDALRSILESAQSTNACIAVDLTEASRGLSQSSDNPIDSSKNCDEFAPAGTSNSKPAEHQQPAVAEPQFVPSPAALKIIPRIVHSLQNSRQVAEKAVVNVCDEVTKLVGLSQSGNDEARSTLHALVGDETHANDPNHRRPISEVIHTQAESMNQFVDETRGFFHQQISVANDATQACKEMQHCATQIAKLVFSSEILAFNIQIESARLGDSGRTFSVLGDEMARFSAKVRDANSLVQQSLTLVTNCMAKFQEESKSMDSRLTTFAQSLNFKMDDVKQQTQALTESMRTTLDHIAARNQEAMGCLQRAFSELQFQDPMSQDLVRTEFEVVKLQRFIETGIEDELLLCDPSGALHAEHSLESGSVQLF